MRYSSLALLLLFTACGGSSPNSENTSSLNEDSSSPSIEGTWKFTGMKCNNAFVSISQYKETLTINGSIGTIENEGNDYEACSATETFTYTADSNYLYLTSDSYACAEESCDFIFNIDGLPTRYRCPESWPFAFGQWAYRVEGNTAYISKDGVCVASYSRQN